MPQPSAPWPAPHKHCISPCLQEPRPSPHCILGASSEPEHIRPRIRHEVPHTRLRCRSHSLRNPRRCFVLRVQLSRLATHVLQVHPHDPQVQHLPDRFGDGSIAVLHVRRDGHIQALAGDNARHGADASQVLGQREGGVGGALRKGNGIGGSGDCGSRWVVEGERGCGAVVDVGQGEWVRGDVQGAKAGGECGEVLVRPLEGDNVWLVSGVGPFLEMLVRWMQLGKVRAKEVDFCTLARTGAGGRGCL